MALSKKVKQNLKKQIVPPIDIYNNKINVNKIFIYLHILKNRILGQFFVV